MLENIVSVFQIYIQPNEWDSLQLSEISSIDS